jgi:hypothetical protein
MDPAPTLREVWNAAQDAMVTKPACGHTWTTKPGMDVVCRRPRGHKGAHCNKLYTEDVRA